MALDPGLDGEAPVPADASALGDAPRIRAILTAAARFIREQQQAVFDFWVGR